MSKLRVHLSIPIDGYGAGPDQDLSEAARSWRARREQEEDGSRQSAADDFGLRISDCE